MKQISGIEIKEFIYESRVKRDYHVAEMEQEGWEESGKVRHLKDGVSVLSASKDDYEWYALFQRNTMK